MTAQIHRRQVRSHVIVLPLCLTLLVSSGCPSGNLELVSPPDAAREADSSSQSQSPGTSPTDFATRTDDAVQPGTTRESFACRRRGDYLTVPVHIAGNEYTFILDTGSQVTLVDLPLRELLRDTGRQLPLSDGNQSNIRRLYALPEDARVGTSMELASIPFVLCNDCGPFRDVVGVPFDGILGCDFLDNKKLQIDFENGVITFFDQLDGDKRQFGQELTMERNSNRLPTVSIAFGDGRVFPCVIDTGAFGISMVLDRFSYAYLEDIGSLKGQTSLDVLSVNGPTEEREGRVTRTTIAGHTLQDIKTQTGPYCSVGLDFLSRFRVTFDFANDKVFFRKSQRFHDGPDQNSTGAKFRRMNGTFVVQEVERESIAWQEGLRKGDVITNVNGCNTSLISTFDMRAACSLRDGHLRMKITREAETVEVNLPERRRIARKTH